MTEPTFTGCVMVTPDPLFGSVTPQMDALEKWDNYGSTILPGGHIYEGQFRVRTREELRLRAAFH